MRKNMNLYGADLNDAEGLELRQNIEDNFGELYPEGKNYADEPTAARAGVDYGQLYHTNGTVKVRYSLLKYPNPPALVLQGATPAILHTMTRTPAAGALTLSGIAPSRTQQWTILPPTVSLSLTGAAPALT